MLLKAPHWVTFTLRKSVTLMPLSVYGTRDDLISGPHSGHVLNANSDIVADFQACVFAEPVKVVNVAARLEVMSGAIACPCPSTCNLS